MSTEHKSAAEVKREAYEAGRLDTTDGKPPESFETDAPGPIKPHDGQHSQYWVLSESERAKGFVRPVRSSYRHVGRPGPTFPLRDLTDDEHQRYDQYGYVSFEAYPEGHSGCTTGRFWKRADFESMVGCGTVTTMGRALAETYAREPKFYGATMCVGCGKHLPVGEDGEFVWTDGGERVGT